jgi:hypothetical protein
VLVVCPASLCLKWQAEMHDRFGLEFQIVDAEAVKQLRHERGVSANIWTSFPRVIVSIDCDGDLDFLWRISRKVDTIRDDLGTAGPVLAQQVEEAMRCVDRRMSVDWRRHRARESGVPPGLGPCEWPLDHVGDRGLGCAAGASKALANHGQRGAAHPLPLAADPFSSRHAAEGALGGGELRPTLD